MPLLCAMGRRREKEKEVVEEDRQLQRAAAAEASTSVAAVVPRRGRWSDGEQQESVAGQAAAGRAGWRCQSCAAAAIADCVALGCCPCAVVTLVALALVRAPIAVGRRLRRRKRSLQLLRRKRVRDVAATAKGTARARDDKGAKKAAGAAAAEPPPQADGHATVSAAAAEPVQRQPQDEVVEEPAWLDEMYRAGHWGFGRVSFSGSMSIGGGENPNLVTGRCAGS